MQILYSKSFHVTILIKQKKMREKWKMLEEIECGIPLLF